MHFQMIDEHGWTQKEPISDCNCILICLKNAPCGIDRKQVERIVKEIENECKTVSDYHW